MLNWSAVASYMIARRNAQWRMRLGKRGCGAAQRAPLSAAALLTARAVRTDRAAHPGAVAGAPLPAAADPGSDAPHHAACAKVLRGLRNHWEGLTLFVEHADLPMDNYLSSRARAARPGGGERFHAAAECSSPAREQSAAPPAGPLPVDTNAMM